MDDLFVHVRRISNALDKAMDTVESIFDDALEGTSVRLGHSTHKVTKEKRDGLPVVTVELEVPGCKKGDVDVSVSSRSLQVEWTRKLDGQKSSVKIAISEKADLDAISAKVEDGYMTIVIPAAQPQAAKKVRVD